VQVKYTAVLLITFLTSVRKLNVLGFKRVVQFRINE